MGTLLGFGMTDKPPMQMSDLKLSRSLQEALSDERIADALRDVAAWPEEMRVEWGLDMGQKSASAKRAEAVRQARLVRKALDRFAPDAVILLAKDHGETVQSANLYVPYWICAFDEVVVKPYQLGNIFGESPEVEVLVPCARQFALELTNGLGAEGISPTVFNRPSSPVGLGHTYRSTVVLMDWDARAKTFPLPMVPMPFNPFGNRGRDVLGLEPLRAEHRLPATMPEAFALGRAIARVVKAGEHRVALGVAAGWSHANDTSWERSWLSPDVDADRRLFEDWSAGKIEQLAELGPEDLEEHGRWELWGWAVLAGAMSEVGAPIAHAHLETNWIFNSDWVTTIFEER